MTGQPEPIRPISPATGAALDPIASTTGEELEAIVARARAAQGAWAAKTVEERAAGIREFGRELGTAESIETVARTISEEMGKPIRSARSEVKIVARRVENFVDRAHEAVASEHTGSGPIEVEVEWRPLGVAAVVAPWNYPLSTPNNLVLSALLTGNTVVLKPSEFTPRTGAIYHSMLSRHLPDGVFGLVQGAGDVGAKLVAGDVDVVAFTGSIRTGQAIMKAAADGMKRLVLELGGKDPMIVLPGADLDVAAKHAAAESVRNCGQVCISVERIYVHESIAEEFAEKVCDHVRAMRVGNPMDEQTDVGPMVSERQRELVLAQLSEAREQGARFLVEGKASGPGWFLSPSVVSDVRDDMTLGRDETFGPVVSIAKFSDVDDAVRRANESRYGLGASVWGEEGPQLDAVARRIEAGMVGINRGLSAAGSAPWVGWKQSGFGYSRSTAGLRQFMQPRTLSKNVPA